MILPNGKNFGDEQPLAELDCEILVAEKRDWNLELGMDVLAKEQWEPLKNQRLNWGRFLGIFNLIRFFVLLLDYSAQQTTPQGGIKSCCMSSTRSS